MSGPLPGPMRPPTDDPKTNVLMYAMLGCVVAAFCTIVMADGAWRWLAAIPIALGTWLLIKSVRAHVAHIEGSGGS